MRRLPLLCLFALVPTGCGDPAPPPSAAAPKFPGVALTIALDKTSPIADPLALRVADWEHETGAKVEFVDATAAATADLYAVSPGKLATLADLAPLPREILDDGAVLYIQFPYVYRAAFAARDPETPIALPLATERVLLWHRRDLYRDPALKEAWQDAGNRAADFAPPKTWDAYLKQAKFFQARKAVKYGCAEAADGSPEAVRNFLVRAQSYAAAPRLTPIDPETGVPGLAEAECRRAADDWLAARKLGPGGNDAAARAAFAAGEAAFLISALPPTLDAKGSRLKGLAQKAGPSPLPAAAETYDRAAKQWLPNPEPRGVVHYAGGGHVLAFSAKTAQPKACVALLRYLGDGAKQGYLVQGARRGLLPLRAELLNDSGRFEGYGLATENVAELFKLVREGLRVEHYAADPRCPGAHDLLAALGSALNRIAAGTAPAEALAEADAFWRKEIAAKGPRFLAAFRNGLGLAPKAQ